MASSENLPTGLSEHKTTKSDLPPIGTYVEKEPSRPIIQRAEDNPRPAEPTRAQNVSVKEPPAAAPAIPVQQPPQTFSNSRWARRNARIKAIRSFFPGKVIEALCMIAGFFLFLLLLAHIAILASGPSTLAMIIGATICKASKLPYLPMTTAARVGAVGGPFAAMTCIPFAVVTMLFCIHRNEQLRLRGIRSGKLPLSCKRSGHFPDMLLLTPLIFFNCLIGGVIGHSIFVVRPISRQEVAVMATIGGLVLAPIFPTMFFIFCGVIEVLWRLVCEVSQGYPNAEPDTVFPYLRRQFGVISKLPGRLLGWNRSSSSPAVLL